MSENGSCARYFVEELIGGMHEGTWIDLSTMAIQRGGSSPEPFAKKTAINASRGTGAPKRTPASKDERRVSSLQTPLEPIIALLRGLIVGSRNAQRGTVKTPEAKKTPQASNAV
jgi:hypothetical protein